MFAYLRLFTAGLLFFLSIAVAIPAQALCLKIGGRAAKRIPLWWHRFVLRLFDIRLVVHGSISDRRPLLLLSNHISWLDISVLSAIAPVSFIAKKEVADWPLFGLFAKLQRSVFIDREKRHSTGRATDEIAERLHAGDVMVLFPEGTSSDGNHVLPFRSAILGAAQRGMLGENPATLQPVAIAYTRMLGMPLGRQHRPWVAWFGDLDLLPHLAKLLSRGGIDVHVAFLPPVEIGAGSDRKAAARAAGVAVHTAVSELNTGRDPDAVMAAIGTPRA
ncbi:1-acyl-sn-glycerol-3-phosphate acyltransferase [Afifella sp. IM 167]|uniref:lysophospholipid acyltransferase family protein n=1 Tax=Afifella sp. IM 167 TaxID=2033586 RepID=UPI001CCE1B3F|nr:lysophospholipid acyltransferase family protein [Afifella sp. IM 167]MBZ8133725.1 1-acyl-sn-glycerol-3-phosphate acyltransferase [Afifella sp. IM 167]